MFSNIISYLTSPYNFVNIPCELPDDVPNNFVRIKYLYCGICGGDYSRYLGYRDSYPISLGHEFVAEVLGINCDVELNYNLGDFVVSDFNYRCMKCEYCKSEKTHLCKKNSIEYFTNRAFSLYADVHYSYLVKTNIPRNYIYRATTIEPLSCVIHALDHYNMSELKTVLIFGTGNIGMLCAFYLGYCKKKTVYLYDIKQKRLCSISKLFSCNIASFEISYDLVIEATNSRDGFLECIEKCPYDQSICSFSHLYGQDTTSIYDKLVKKESSVYFPLRNGSIKTLYLASKYIEDNWLLSFDKLFKIYETDNINSAFMDKCNCDQPKQIIKFVIDK